MDWSPYFPDHFDPPDASEAETRAGSIARSAKRVEFADIGCGFGGLLVALAPMFPDTLMLGAYTTTATTSHIRAHAICAQAWKSVSK